MKKIVNLFKESLSTGLWYLARVLLTLFTLYYLGSLFLGYATPLVNSVGLNLLATLVAISVIAVTVLGFLIRGPWSRWFFHWIDTLIEKFPVLGWISSFYRQMFQSLQQTTKLKGLGCVKFFHIAGTKDAWEAGIITAVFAVSGVRTYAIYIPTGLNVAVGRTINVRADSALIEVLEGVRPEEILKLNGSWGLSFPATFCVEEQIG